MLAEVLACLLPEGRAIERIIDGTLGAGGHASAMLAASKAQLLGLDLDDQALALARLALEPYAERAQILQMSYLKMTEAAAQIGWDKVDAILLDLGVSSMQLDTAERGFAFRHDGPLDMRFTSTDNRQPASDLVNHWDEGALSEIFYRYGEEPQGRRVARAIIAARPLHTTQQLADVVAAALPRLKKGKKREGPSTHPATRVFQALRIAVNDELRVVEAALPLAIDLLRPGGRLGVISFHSLEDRIVKQVFRDASLTIEAPPGMASIQTRQATIVLLHRKPLEADAEEVAQNPRSRSAKLRVIEKL